MLSKALRCALFCALTVPTCLVADAQASLQVGDTIKFINREGNTGGGEFGVVSTSDLSTELFRTFCVQVNEYMNFSSVFRVDGISMQSESDGTPLALGTALLYQQFRIGMDAYLANSSNNIHSIFGVDYDYTPNTSGHQTDANALQKAIWHFQGQSGYGTVYGQALSLVTATNNFIAANPNATTGGVKILNLVFNHNNAEAQDQLYWEPAPGPLPNVPEPMSLAVWGGLAALGLVHVRRNRKS